MEKPRYWEVDALRGLAIVLMVAYHFFFDIGFLEIASIDLQDAPLLILQRTTAFLFLVLVGVSLALGKPDFKKTLNRAAKLGAIAILITIATSIYPGKGAIVFGIIHFIAVSVLLGYFFLSFKWLTLLAALGVLAAWILAGGFIQGSPYLIWLGFPPADFYTLDYYPLLPWFSLVLFGIFIGKTFFPLKNRIAMSHLIEPLCFLGRNSLAIYLLHQPVLIVALSALKSFV